MKRTYSEMKDSGVEWIGEIPKEWEVKKIKYMFYVVSGATPKSDNCDYWNGNIIWITPADYKTLDKYIKSGSRNISKLGLQSCSATLVPSGSIIFSKRAPIGAIAVAEIDLCTNQGCLSCVPRQGAHSIFYYYVMSIATEDFELKGTGTTFKEISATSFNDSLLPFPSLSEQNVIANYLDEKCAEIDSIISEAKNCIEEYKQWKSAIIFETVTKGLDPNVEMKDSGVEWIGEIPKEWEIIKIKNVAYLDPNCYKPFESCEVSFAPMDCIRTNQRIEKVALLSTDNDSYSSFNNGDIALAKVSPCFENKNVCIMDNLKNLYAFGSSELFNLRPFNIITRFLLYWLQTDRFVENGVACMTGVAGLKRIPSWYIKNAYITYLPLSEQTAIANYLDAKCSQIDEVISEKEALILDLELYKKSLIYEVVTGKVKVS